MLTVFIIVIIVIIYLCNDDDVYTSLSIVARQRIALRAVSDGVLARM